MPALLEKSISFASGFAISLSHFGQFIVASFFSTDSTSEQRQIQIGAM